MLKFLSKKIPKQFYLTSILLLFLTSALLGQITVPEKVGLGEKIVATVAAEGEHVLLWRTSQGLQTEQTGNSLFIWGKPGKYVIDVVVIPLKSITIEGETVQVISGSIKRYNSYLQITGSGPDPGPDPPDPQNVPFQAPGFSVLLLKEAQETGRLPKEQVAIFTSPQVIRYLSQATQGRFRIWDDDYTPAQFSNVPGYLKVAYTDVLKQAAGQLPWIAISNPDKAIGFSGPLPQTINETLELLKGYQ